MSSNFPNHILLGINPVVAVVGLEFDVVAIGFVELGFVFVAVVVVDLVGHMGLLHQHIINYMNINHCTGYSLLNLLL